MQWTGWKLAKRAVICIRDGKVQHPHNRFGLVRRSPRERRPSIILLRVRVHFASVEQQLRDRFASVAFALSAT